MFRCEMNKLAISISLFALSASVLFASTASSAVEASRCLAIKVAPGQEIADIFSRDISFLIEGYDPYVRRVSGTGYYQVKQVTIQEIVTTSTFLYDGSPASTAHDSQGRWPNGLLEGRLLSIHRRQRSLDQSTSLGNAQRVVACRSELGGDHFRPVGVGAKRQADGQSRGARSG